MGERRKAREFAMQYLYQRLVAPSSEEKKNFEGEAVESNKFAKHLIDGTINNLDEIDRVISGASTNWRVDRMAAVDRSILRMAVYELIFENDIPAKVTINEAVDIAKRFGSDKSGSFINGVLDQIAGNLKK